MSNAKQQPLIVDGMKITRRDISIDEFLKEQENSHKPKKVLAHFPEMEVMFRGKPKTIVNEARWCSNWFWKGFHGVTQFSRDWSIESLYATTYEDVETGEQTLELSAVVKEYIPEEAEIE